MTSRPARPATRHRCSCVIHLPRFVHDETDGACSIEAHARARTRTHTHAHTHTHTHNMHAHAYARAQVRLDKRSNTLTISGERAFDEEQEHAGGGWKRMARAALVVSTMLRCLMCVSVCAGALRRDSAVHRPHSRPQRMCLHGTQTIKFQTQDTSGRGACVCKHASARSSSKQPKHAQRNATAPPPCTRTHTHAHTHTQRHTHTHTHTHSHTHTHTRARAHAGARVRRVQPPLCAARGRRRGRAQGAKQNGMKEMCGRL